MKNNNPNETKSIKTKHPSKKKQPRTKPCAPKIKRFDEEFYDYSLGGIMHVHAADYMEKLGLELIAWAKHQEHEKFPKVTLNSFYIAKNMSKRTFENWCLKYPILNDCKEQAKMILAELRENGVANRRFNHVLLEKNMHNYSDEWAAVNEYWKEMRQLQKDNESKIEVVVLDRTPDTGIKPMTLLSSETDEDEE